MFSIEKIFPDKMLILIWFAIYFSGQRFQVPSDFDWEQNPQTGSLLQIKACTSTQLEIVSLLLIVLHGVIIQRNL